MIRVLLIGCGDIALRTALILRGRVRLYGLTRRPEDVVKLRHHGIVPIVGDLDRYQSLDRLRAAPFAVLHFAPPPGEGRDDPRTARLIAALGDRVFGKNSVLCLPFIPSLSASWAMGQTTMQTACTEPTILQWW